MVTWVTATATATATGDSIRVIVAVPLASIRCPGEEKKAQSFNALSLSHPYSFSLLHIHNKHIPNLPLPQLDIQLTDQ